MIPRRRLPLALALALGGLSAAQPQSPAARSQVQVPGGLHALSFIARGKPKPTAEGFFADYCRALIHRSNSADPRINLANQNRLRAYFRRLADLETLGRRDGNRLAITLSNNTRDSQRVMERVSNLLGWRAHTSGGEVALAVAEKTAQSARKEMASALDVDEIGMQEALQSGRPFRLEIRWEPAEILLDEKTWRSHFYLKENYAGGFAEALVVDPRLAKLYLGLSTLDEEARAALLSAVPLKELALKFTDRLYLHASALAVEDGRAALPGLAAAEPIWTKLAGADPRRPGAFFRALLEKDRGRLLAFFSVLSRLDAAHQRFALRSPARAQKLYELFNELPGLVLAADREILRSSFLDFLQTAPLDAEGRLVFPGALRLWLPPQTAAGPVTPELEDRIVEHLARTRRSSTDGPVSELDAFVAVARIDAHRGAPRGARGETGAHLSETAAALLYRNFQEFQDVYPYFTMLTGVTERELSAFFAFAEKLRQFPRDRLETVVGQWHSLTILLALAEESGALPPKQAAQLFGQLCERLAADSPADATGASLDLVRSLVQNASNDAVDEALQNLLLGSGEPVRFELGGIPRQIDPAAARNSKYQEVLDHQQVPTLGVLLGMLDAARAIGSGQRRAAEHLARLEGAVKQLPAAELPRDLTAPQKAKLERAAPGRIANVLSRLRRRIDAGARDVQQPVAELLAELSPQVTLALSGIVYARFLDPDDLLVAEDPLFLRKHRFVITYPLRRLWPQSALQAAMGERGGSFLEGGFAQMSYAAGQVALAGAKQTDSNSEAIFTAQLGSLRATDWRSVRDEDLRLVSAKMRLGRHWIERAASDASRRAEIAEATHGLLSLARRARMLQAIQAGDPKLAASVLTPADLYFLADRYLARHAADPWQSEEVEALRQAARNSSGARLELLGSSLPNLRGCPHPHLAALPPYEEFDSHLMPSRMAERMAEFKLYLADYASRRRIPAAALGALAAPMALEILRELPMTDLRDWRSVRAAFSEIGDTLLESVLPKP